MLFLLLACRALGYHWIVAKCFQLRVGFAPDGPHLPSGFALSSLAFIFPDTVDITEPFPGRTGW